MGCLCLEVWKNTGIKHISHSHESQWISYDILKLACRIWVHYKRWTGHDYEPSQWHRSWGFAIDVRDEFLMIDKFKHDISIDSALFLPLRHVAEMCIARRCELPQKCCTNGRLTINPQAKPEDAYTARAVSVADGGRDTVQVYCTRPHQRLLTFAAYRQLLLVLRPTRFAKAVWNHSVRLMPG